MFARACVSHPLRFVFSDAVRLTLQITPPRPALIVGLTVFVLSD